MNLLTALTLTKVKITGYKVKPDGKINKSGPKKMDLQVNPNSITHSFVDSAKKEKTEHSKNDQGAAAIGSPAPPPTPPQDQKESFSFDFVLDATGIIPGCEDIKEELKKFNEAVYYFDGEIHRPRVIHLTWGDTFKSGKTNKLLALELKSLSVTYTLFKPGGTPLRASVKVTFEEYVVLKEALLSSDFKSPDMTHIRTVGVGDSLPAMCHEIYGDGHYYLEVARYNNLNSFLSIKPGQELYFPPLEK